MSATIDGVPWITDCVTVVFSEGLDQYQLVGTDNRNGGAVAFRRIGITLPLPARTGTFPMKVGFVDINASNFMVGPGDGGRATITTYTSTHIAGTFLFTTGEKSLTGRKGLRSVTVADGRFNITFTR